jgi:hypothetical protein
VSDTPDGFKPVDEPPRFATAPPPDVIVPRAERPAEPARLIETNVTFETKGDVQVVDKETFEAAVSAVGASTAEAPAASPISVTSNTSVRFKVRNPDGTVTERVFNPRASQATLVVVGFGVFVLLVGFLVLVAILER